MSQSSLMSTELISKTHLFGHGFCTFQFSIHYFNIAILIFKNIWRGKWIITLLHYIAKFQNTKKLKIGMWAWIYLGSDSIVYYAWEILCCFLNWCSSLFLLRSIFSLFWEFLIISSCPLTSNSTIVKGWIQIFFHSQRWQPSAYELDHHWWKDL